MADADVQVTFGAKIDGLISGVDAVKSALDGLNSKLETVHKNTQEMSGHVNTASSALKAFAVAFVSAFSIEGIENFVASMAKMGDTFERVGLTLAIPSERVANLAITAKLTGSSLEALSKTIEHMALNIARSARDGANPFAVSLKNIGLSVKDFKDLKGDEYFSKVSEAAAKLGPSMNLTSNLMVIGGKTMADMVGTLIKGKKAFEEMAAATKEARDSIALAAPGMADTHSKLSLLSVAVDGFRARVFSALKPGFDKIIEMTTEFVRSLDEGKVNGAVKFIINAMFDLTKSLYLFFKDLGIDIDKIITKIKEFIEVVKDLAAKAGNVGAIAKGMGAGAVIGGGAGAMFGGVGAVPGAVGGAVVGGFVAADIEANKLLETQQSIRRETIATLKPIQAIGDGWAKDGATLDPYLEKLEKMRAGTLALVGKGMPGADLTSTFVKPPSTGQRDDAIAVAMRQVAEVDRIYQMSAEKAEHTFKMSVDFFGQAESQKTQALLSALATRENAELAIMLNLQHKYAEGTNERRRVEDEITKIVQKATNDRQKINDHAAEATWQKWKSASDQLAGTFSTAFQGLITGGQTVSQVMQGLVRSLINTMISEVTKMVFQVIAQKTMLLVTGQGFAAADVATTVAAEGAKTGAVTAGVAARTSAEAAGSGAGILTTIFDAIGFIFAQAGKAFAAVFALFAGIMGPAAAGPASAAASEVIAGGTALAVGGAAVGTDYVMKSGLAVIHQGEQVVPADIGGAYTGARSGGSGAGGGGGGSVSVNISAWDGGSIHRWLSTGGAAQLAKAIGPVLNRNPSLRPSY